MLFGRKWRLVDTELDTGVELDATEWRGVAGVELVGGTDLDKCHGRRMERRHNRWRNFGRGHATGARDGVGVGKGKPVPQAGATQSKRATWAGSVWMDALSGASPFL